MSEATVEIRREGRIGILMFNRPKALNAFSSAVVTQTTAALKVDPRAVAALSASSKTSVQMVRRYRSMAIKAFSSAAGARSDGRRSLWAASHAPAAFQPFR